MRIYTISSIDYYLLYTKFAKITSVKELKNDDTLQKNIEFF